MRTAHKFNVGAYSVAEVTVRTVREVATEVEPLVSRAEQAAKFFRDVVTRAEWFDADKECVVILMLNARDRVKGWGLVSLGSLTGSLAHPREVLRAAIVGAANSFVLLHNHPSGDPSPSSADMTITRTINAAAKACEIPFVDHVIVGSVDACPIRLGHYSFREAGVL